MEVISFIVLILLSLTGYSAGATGKAGKFADLKPQIVDLTIVLLIWAGAIYSRITFDLKKWFLILIWVILSIIVGILAILFRKLPEKKISNISNKGKSKKVQSNILNNLEQSWKNFSTRIGSFQSRIILSLFFFFFVSPFALAVKMFSDPLKIKHQSSKSHWLPKREIKIDQEQYKTQF